MFYDSELRFLRATLRKCRLQVFLLDPVQPLGDLVSVPSLLLGLNNNPAKTFYDYVSTVDSKTMYRLTDPLGCRYIFLKLPDTTPENILLIGPYLPMEQSQQQMLECAESLGIAPSQLPLLQKYYQSTTVLPDNSPLLSVIDTFCECIWGGSAHFTSVDINQEDYSTLFPLPGEKNITAEPKPPLWDMQVMEMRYAYENDLMDAVAHGQIHKVELFMSNFSEMAFDRRSNDPVRNMKNYCIIMNTLLRKAAESGGVHPIYLDRLSSSFARKIESVPSENAVLELMSEMFRSYCRLVRKHTTRQFSPPVQKAIICIDSDLTANLTLRALANMQNISAGYLSTLFKRETGQTLTEHVNQKRVKLAMQLLSSTKLQIQTVAQHCGILDIHYFAKIFKNYTGKTPREYRASIQGT